MIKEKKFKRTIKKDKLIDEIKNLDEGVISLEINGKVIQLFGSKKFGDTLTRIDEKNNLYIYNLETKNWNLVLEFE